MKTEIPEFPHLLPRIGRLSELAYNFWWSWNADARAVFRQLDLTLWERTHRNPVALLNMTSPERLARSAQDPCFLELYDSVLARFDQYLSSTETWFTKSNFQQESLIAYFCAEFAVHSSIPIYSGGLGLLAADTCKEASDLGIPLIAIGFLYPEGYFHQSIEADGRQTALYERVNLEQAPLLPLLNDDNSRFLVTIPIAERTITIAVWKIQVGRVPIYLLDTNIPENDAQDRHLSMRLYIGDPRLRLEQEIILGIGGIRVLRALEYAPTVFHLNEGHSAFATFELLGEAVQSGSGFEAAIEKIRDQTVFTTHTPILAGHDTFPFQMMEESFSHFWQERNLNKEQCLELGRDPNTQTFSMTVLLLRLAGITNGVSKKHGQVSREMWHFLWPDKEVDQVPITSITNGVHLPTWLARELAPVFQQFIGPDWWERHDDPTIWDRVFEIPDEKLWEIHLLLKSKLHNFIREQARRRWVENHISGRQVVAFGALLNSEALTIGFARRFATYKRATLLLSDRERLKRLLHNPWRPVQIIFTGKAHPDDEPGKDQLQEIFEACSSPEFQGRLAFIEEYDKHVALYLVQGVDVWLNTPLPPREACGTSGQKAALNGVPNCSVLDGWWCEGYNGKNGWAIDEDPSGEDAKTALGIYETLEQQIVPAFYERDPQGIPRQWVGTMKEAIRSAAAPFSARRMLKQYMEKMYTLHVSRPVS
jgi:starch phosphorylase